MGGNEFEEVLSRAGGFWRAGRGHRTVRQNPLRVRSEERDKRTEPGRYLG